jgi:hypothetical protein
MYQQNMKVKYDELKHLTDHPFPDLGPVLGKLFAGLALICRPPSPPDLLCFASHRRYPGD